MSVYECLTKGIDYNGGQLGTALDYECTFLSDQGPIIGYACQWLPPQLLFRKLDAFEKYFEVKIQARFLSWGLISI